MPGSRSLLERGPRSRRVPAPAQPAAKTRSRKSASAKAPPGRPSQHPARRLQRRHLLRRLMPLLMTRSSKRLRRPLSVGEARRVQEVGRLNRRRFEGTDADGADAAS
jgi:hypothetical protein